MTVPDAEGPPRDGAPEAAADRSLDGLRERVAVVGSLPVADRPAVFTEVNAAIVAELDLMGGPIADAVTLPDESGATEA